jgi:hypothetical protein
VTVLPALTDAGPLLVTAKSELRCTVALVEEVLLRLFESAESLETVPEFDSVDPSASEAAVCAWIRNVNEPPAANVPRLNGLAYADPVDGSQPTPVQYFAPDSPVGRLSASCTFAASEGPPLEIVNVYVIGSPAFTLAGPDFDRLRSELRLTVVVTLLELFAALPSLESLATEAVFVNELAAAVEAGTDA